MTQNNSLPAHRRLNLVVVGKSGVGKSSFLNYAAGRKVFATGSGDPVTDDYFDSVVVNSAIPGVDFALFDTKGIENDNTGEWTQRIFDEIERRDASPDIYNWFHTIIYCISAGDKRIEDFEIDAIRKLMNHGSVMVLLTKKDQATPEQLAALRDRLLVELGSQVQILSVCNGAETRAGVTPPSGLEDVLRASFLGLWEKAARTLPRTALQAAMSINAEFAMRPTASNLLCTMALTAVAGNIFPDIIALARLTCTSVRTATRYIHKTGMVTESFFESAMSPVRGTVSMSDNGMVLISYISPRNLTLSMPLLLNRGALAEKYYRKALKAWIVRWGSLSDELLARLRNGEMRQSFTEIVDATVAEILSFYNQITDSSKRPLVLHKTIETLDALQDTEVVNSGRREVSYRVRLLDDALDRAGRLFAGESSRINAQMTYMSLAHKVNNINNELNAPFERITDALETELRAYGQYCLRNDELATATDIALVERLVRTALAESADRIISPATYSVIAAVAADHGIGKARLDDIIAAAR